MYDREEPSKAHLLKVLSHVSLLNIAQQTFIYQTFAFSLTCELPSSPFKFLTTNATTSLFSTPSCLLSAKMAYKLKVPNDSLNLIVMTPQMYIHKINFRYFLLLICLLILLLAKLKEFRRREEAWNRFSLRTLRRNKPCQHLDFRLFAF